MTGPGLVLVSGATGRQGGAIAEELLDAGWHVRAMTRHPDADAARALASRGAEVVGADFDDAASLRRALDGAWGALSVQNTWEAGVVREEEQGKRFARVARDAGVQHLVYQSVASADRRTGIPHFDSKARVEETIHALGLPSWVVLRPVYFMENLLSASVKAHLDRDTLALGVQPETRLQMVAVADVGRYGLRAFERHDALNGRSFDLAGDAQTGPEMAEILSGVTGRTITFQPVPIEDVRRTSDARALMLDWFDRGGFAADIEATAAELDVQPTRFRDWAEQQDWAPAP